MGETVKVVLTPETASRLKLIAARGGETIDVVAQRLIDTALDEFAFDAQSVEASLSESQLDELRRRASDPGPYASAERTAAVLSKFKA